MRHVGRPVGLGLVPRVRLFRALDRGAAGRVVWIAAPPGAGKTSLVSGWLDARRHRCVWHNVDVGDVDPARFFERLASAAGAVSPRRRTALPQLTPEYLPHLAGYVRRYAELFWKRLGSPVILVFDDFQLLAVDSPTHTMLSDFLRCVPPGCLVVFSSHEGPPPALAPWRADAGFSAVGGESLHLTDQEAGSIARARGVEGVDAARLNALARGWSAGLVLLLRAVEDGVFDPLTNTNAHTTGVSSPYFAAEIFARLGPGEQHVLLSAAVPSRVSGPLATALSGDARAGDVLAALHRRRFFTERIASTRPPYEYEFHPLFRDFLLEVGAQQFGAGHADLRRKAGQFLEAEDDPEGALALYLEAEAWPDAIRLVCQLAPEAARHGRAKTVDAWIEAIPETVRRNVPWVVFWQGACRAMSDPAAGRVLLASAHERFVRAGDATGALLAASEILTSFVYSQADFSPATPWIDQFEALLGPEPATAIRLLPDDVAIRVISAAQTICHHQTWHPLLRTLAALAEDYGARSSDTELRLHALLLPTLYWSYVGDLERAKRTSDVAAKSMTSTLALGPAILHCVHRAMVLWLEGDERRALEAVAHGEALAEQSGIAMFNGILMAQRGYIALSRGDLAEAERLLEAMGAGVEPNQEHAWAFFRALQAAALLRAGRAPRAGDVFAECVRFGERAGFTFYTASCRIQWGQALMVDGRHIEAREQFDLALTFAERMSSDILTFHAHIAAAYTWLAEGVDRNRVVSHLRKALAIGRRRDYMNCHPVWLPKVMTEVFRCALEERIESDYVCRVIRHKKLAPDGADVEGWPWPTRVYMLGTFRLHRDDQPVHLGRKTPRRVLELLHAIVAIGAHGVSRERLIEALWPDAEGDAGRDAFEIALHRLRKLLGDDEAIRLTNGVVSIDSGRVWVDVTAFGQIADGVHSPATMNRALSLYGGSFLSEQPERPWMLPMRDRLHSKFCRLVGRIDAHLDETKPPADAIALFQRAIDVDPLVEEFYQGLMRAQVRGGNHAGALATYGRCRDVLWSLLKVKPAAETERLRASADTERR